MIVTAAESESSRRFLDPQDGPSAVSESAAESWENTGGPIQTKQRAGHSQVRDEACGDGGGAQVRRTYRCIKK